jgi:hypothetical protein
LKPDRTDLGRSGAGWRRRSPESPAPRRRFAGSSSERAAWALQAVFWAAVWSWSLCAGRLNHLGTQNGRLGAGRGSLRRGAALQRRCSPERVCRRCQGLRATETGAREGGVWSVAHRGLGQSDYAAQMTGGEVGRRRTDGVRDTGRCRGRGRRRGLGGVPGLRAELVRWISGARERQGGGSTEAQRPCAAERDAARRAGVRWRLKSGMGCRGVRWGQK